MKSSGWIRHGEIRSRLSSDEWAQPFCGRDFLKSRTGAAVETKIKYPLKSGQDFTGVCAVAISLSRENAWEGREEKRARGRPSYKGARYTHIQPFTGVHFFFHALATECKSNRRGNLKSARPCWRTCKLVRERRRHRRPASAPRGVNEIPRRWKGPGRTWN